jgi:methionyl-tRNA formyltransferase
MRVLFFGTPHFAVPSLEAVASRHQVVAVVTQPDRPAGRGRRPTPPPVAVRARELGLPVLQPERLRDVREELERLRPDVGVVVAYGKVLPRWLLALPRHGCVNLHPSRLPRHRGASPIQAALLSGDPVTGVSVVRVTEELDAGDILAQREVPVRPDDTAGTLAERLSREGAELLVEVLDALDRGEVTAQPQDPREATYCGRLTKEDGRILWDQPAQAVERHVRAMDPWPVAYTNHRGVPLRVWRVRPAEGEGPPGEVLRLSHDGFVVATGSGAVEVLEVQPASGRRMRASDYARGHRVQVGERLG